MRFWGLGIAVLLAGGPPLLAAGAGQGMTPGGLVWSVTGSRLVLYGTDGAERASFPLAPKEGEVLGVDDEGARVTSGPRGAVEREDPFGEARESTARLVFRDRKGNALATREISVLRGTTPAVLGTEAYSVRKTGASFTLQRASAAEEGTPLAKIPLERVLAETGKVEEVTVHASAAGLVVVLRGPYRSVYVDVARPDRWVLPDPALACGGAGDATVFPSGRGLARVTKRWDEGPLRLERLGRDGELEASYDLGEPGLLLALPGGGFALLRGNAIRVHDDEGRELSRATLAGAPAAPPLPPGPPQDGGSWAEHALAGSPLATAPQSFLLLRRDPEGAFRRLARVAEEDAALGAARQALSWVLSANGRQGDAYAARMGEAAGSHDGSAALRSARALAESGAPAWFRRAIAAPLLADPAPPAWALAALVDAVVRGEAGGALDELPPSAVTPELAELVSAVDRARIEAFERAHPGTDPSALRWGTPDEEAPEDAWELRFHLDAARHAALLLSCAEGAGPIGLGAVVEAFRLLAASVQNVDPPAGEVERAVATHGARPGPPVADPDAAGRAVRALVEAVRSEDPARRAAATLLSPWFALPIDADRFRADVLRRRPGIAGLALPALLADRSLPDPEWTRLFGEALLSARAESPDPLRCATRALPFGGPGSQDPYCLLVASLFGWWGGEEGDSSRTAALAAYTASAAAPPEVRVHARLGRINAGAASGAELLALWRDASLPFEVRRMALGTWRGDAPLAALAPELARELREERLPAQEERAVLDALKKADAAGLSRIAADRWERGAVPLGEGNEDLAESWARAVDPTTVAARPGLRDGLRRALDDPGAGPQAAGVLAKAGDRAALPRLVFAIRTGCFG